MSKSQYDELKERVGNPANDRERQAAFEAASLAMGKRLPTFVEVIKGFSILLTETVGKEAALQIVQAAGIITGCIMADNDAEAEAEEAKHASAEASADLEPRFTNPEKSVG